MTHRDRRARFIVIACALLFARGLAGEQRGVISDPDGFVNLRARDSAEAAIVGKVKEGEVLRVTCGEDTEWCKVTLASGRSGSMHRSRIRLHFTEKDLPKPVKKGEPLSEIDEFVRGRGLDYAAVAKRAARGDAEALRQLFEISKDVDGAGAESHRGVDTVVYHLLGDKKFAQFLEGEPISDRMTVRNLIVEFEPMADEEYLRRNFPLTAQLLFRREIVGWPSPDQRFAIRKVFSDEQVAGSKVARAEVIEQPSGKVLADLTSSDIGIGAEREGDVLWSPDSKRFAMLSSDSSGGGNLFEKPTPKPQRKQTAVYELSGDSFVQVDLALGQPPGRAEDAEVARAILGHEHTEPQRWEKPDVLVLQRHEYYQTLKPMEVAGQTFDTVHSFDRLYHITATFSGEGKATLAWKKREDPP